jgi:hypothetical protein
VVALILSVVARVHGVNLRPYRPRSTIILPALKTGELKIYYVEEGNEERILHIKHSVVALILSVVAGVRGVNLRPYRPRRTIILPVLKTGEINVYHVKEGSEESVARIEHSVVALILSVVAGVRGAILRPCRPRRATTLPVLKTGEIKVHHVEEGNE